MYSILRKNPLLNEIRSSWQNEENLVGFRIFTLQPYKGYLLLVLISCKCNARARIYSTSNQWWSSCPTRNIHHHYLSTVIIPINKFVIHKQSIHSLPEVAFLNYWILEGKLTRLRVVWRSAAICLQKWKHFNRQQGSYLGEWFTDSSI